jgi:endonuclease/exonuclease/phosphatase (EEP) superfamily protein YafD
VGVFEAHLLGLAATGAVLGVPGALGGGRGRAWLRLALVGVAVVAVVRLGDELWSPGPGGAGGGGAPGAGERPELRVLSWNLELDARPATDAADGIAALEADLVALQELTPGYAAAIEADPRLRAAYPYRILEPRPGVDGLGLLARAPLLVRGLDDRSRLLRAGLLLEDGRIVEVFLVHASRPPFDTTLSIPSSLDTRRRDADLERIRELIDALGDPAAALVVGDFNATPTEPGMDVLRGGLTDAHAAVGMGPGFTWRPAPMASAGVALLRIDGVRTGAWLAPVAITVDCEAAGDHCRLLVGLRVEPRDGSPPSGPSPEAGAGRVARGRFVLSVSGPSGPVRESVSNGTVGP